MQENQEQTGQVGLGEGISEALQPQSQQIAQPQQQVQDPDVIAMAQAIRQQESGGNFQDIGDGGTSMGAYQWQPETWQAQSQQYLGADAPATPLQATPQQQNMVAYDAISQDKAQGLLPVQIASKWNSGSPDGYLNTAQAHGNTPQYVQDVAANYQAIKSGKAMITGKGGSTPAPDTSQEGMSTFDKILLGISGIGLGVGAAATLNPELLPAAGEAITGALGTATASAGGLLGGIKNVAGPVLAGEGVLSDVKSLFSKGTPTQATSSGDSGAAEVAATNNATTQEEIQQESDEDMQKSLQAAQNVANATNTAMQGTQTGRVLSQQTPIQEGILANAQYGINPEIENGIFNSASALKQSDQTVGDLSNGIAATLDQEGTKANIADAVQEAYANIEKYVPVREQQAAKQHVEEEAQIYNIAHGDGSGSISLGNMERAKREQYQAAGKWDANTTSAKRAAHKAFGVGLRATVANKTKNPDLYNKAMKEEKNLINGQKVLKHLNGKKAPEKKGFLGATLRGYARLAEVAVGAKIGGPLGAVLGELVGEKLNKAIDKRYGKNFFESPEGKKLIEVAAKGHPKVLASIKKQFDKYGVQMETDKRMEKKRQAYKASKETPPEKSEYEPYQKEGVISAGKTAKQKNKKVVKGLPSVQISKGLLPNVLGLQK